MISFLLAAAQIAAPATVECSTTAQRDRDQIFDIGLVCPVPDVDPDGLAATAQDVMGRLDASYPRRGLAEFAATVRFVHDGANWRLAEPTRLLRYHGDYPRVARMRGGVARCDIALTLGEDGRASAVNVACEEYRRLHRPVSGEAFVEAAREVAESVVYLMPEPSGQAPCVRFSLQFSDPNYSRLRQPVKAAPRCPGHTS